jgi:hypothetical protein
MLSLVESKYQVMQRGIAAKKQAFTLEILKSLRGRSVAAQQPLSNMRIALRSPKGSFEKRPIIVVVSPEIKRLPRLRSHPSFDSAPQLLHTLLTLSMLSCPLKFDICRSVEVAAESPDFAV